MGEQVVGVQQGLVAGTYLNYGVGEQVVHRSLNLILTHLSLDQVPEVDSYSSNLDSVIGSQHSGHAVASGIRQPLHIPSSDLDRVNGIASAHAYYRLPPVHEQSGSGRRPD